MIDKKRTIRTFCLFLIILIVSFLFDIFSFSRIRKPQVIFPDPNCWGEYCDK